MSYISLTYNSFHWPMYTTASTISFAFPSNPYKIILATTVSEKSLPVKIYTPSEKDREPRYRYDRQIIDQLCANGRAYTTYPYDGRNAVPGNVGLSITGDLLKAAYQGSIIGALQKSRRRRWTTVVLSIYVVSYL
jgi:hypothetical protein